MRSSRFISRLGYQVSFFKIVYQSFPSPPSPEKRKKEKNKLNRPLKKTIRHLDSRTFTIYKYRNKDRLPSVIFIFDSQINKQRRCIDHRFSLHETTEEKLAGVYMYVYIMGEKTLFHILFVIKTRLKHHDLEGKMERKNGGTRSSEISARNFFFFFFSIDALMRACRFNEPRKKAKSFRGEHGNYLRGLSGIASSIMKREESCCAPR